MALTDLTEHRLAELQRELPALLVDRNTFAREFEDRAERLVAAIPEAEHEEAWERLRAMVDATGINAGW